jgi:type IV pilus assembly protein PilB
LRSFLRQDPDIILVGEIRDLVTAEIAIKAAMTGHLVLSTLHTNDAPRALVRLLDMGVAEYLISSALNAVVAQRLVRRLCPYCKVQTRLSRSQLESLGVGPGPRGFEAYSAKGCSRCNHTGYKGRVGLYEVLKFSDRVRRCLQQGGSVFEIQETALAEGMVTMRQSGVQKIRQGITSVQEVIRATAGPDPGQGDDFGQGPRPAEGP